MVSYSEEAVRNQSDTDPGLLATLEIRSNLRDEIRQNQGLDSRLQKYRELTISSSKSRFKVADDGTLLFDHRVCVPDNEELKKKIMTEAHESSNFGFLQIGRAHV